MALFAMLLFAITGITLNRADLIPADIDSRKLKVQIQAAELSALKSKRAQPLLKWLKTQHQIDLQGAGLEWSDYELYLSKPRPGKDEWSSIDLETGELIYESSDRGTIALLNDLHKGRNTGNAWRWFIDIFSVICIIFCLSGFGILWMHAKQRLAVWPTAILGIIVPVLLVILTIH